MNSTLILLAANISTTQLTPVARLDIPLYMYILVSLSYGLVFIAGLLGNLLVIYVVCSNSSMRTSTNVFLLNLSIADVLVLVVCMPTALTDFYAKEVWYLGEILCRFVPYLENMTALSSVFTILAISIERYYAICKPLKAQYVCTLRLTGKVILGIWILSIVCNIPFILITFLEETVSYTEKLVYVCRTHISSPLHQSFIISMLIMGLGGPFIVLLFLYGYIIRSLTSTDDFSSSSSSSSSTNGHRNASHIIKQRKQVTVMLIAVIILFFTSLLPFRVISLWLVYASEESVMSLGLEGYLSLLNFARIMFYINSAGNPILYSLFSSKFRMAFTKVFTAQRKRFTTSAQSDPNERLLQITTFPYSTPPGGATQMHQSMD